MYINIWLRQAPNRGLKMLSYSSSVIPFFVSVFISLCSTGALVKLPENGTIPAVIVFGDSIVDAGNNNNLVTVAKSNYPPYGRDFSGGIPTGRFSNGKIPSDFVAELLGIKKLLPAYLDPTLQPSDLLTGVTFASGASGYDPLTSKIPSVFSLSDQLEMFKEYTGKLKAMVGEERTNTILRKSLFLVVQSSNDITSTYFTVRKEQYDFASYADILVTLASSFLKELYGLGARRIAVFGAPPLGCLPSQRSLAGGIQRECAEKLNEAAKLFNTQLSSGLDSLNTNFPLAKFVYVDIYNPLLDIIQNPQKSGLEVANKGCCGTGTIESVVLCNRFNPFTCKDVTKYVFWDSYHPTEKVYKILSRGVIQKYLGSFL
ncbi:GDSL esterase/lipase At3g14820-like [Vitis riparia]|uniref:GDSL esterase/lipase At3g14820-like n=1 Tax=Vitis riparia TaxID=96939 RepID=UPI00155B19FA|nr:GDSL esterase/lipase At3g14820-like [Vitis riparia]